MQHHLWFLAGFVILGIVEYKRLPKERFKDFRNGLLGAALIVITVDFLDWIHF
jgi:hypothetical protein